MKNMLPIIIKHCCCRGGVDDTVVLTPDDCRTHSLVARRTVFSMKYHNLQVR